MYRIEITEITEREVGIAQSYEKVSDADGGKYAYVPVPNRGAATREFTRRVLIQEVETVDVPAVIKAVNGL